MLDALNRGDGRDRRGRDRRGRDRRGRNFHRLLSPQSKFFRDWVYDFVESYIIRDFDDFLWGHAPVWSVEPERLPGNVPAHDFRHGLGHFRQTGGLHQTCIDERQSGADGVETRH